MPDTIAPAGIGHNNPPEPTPFEGSTNEVNALYDEAAEWLDGRPIENQEQADGLGNLQRMLNKARIRADKLRKAEKEPHLKAGKAVDEQWNPLIAKAKTAEDVASAAVTKWLVEQQRLADEEARKKREEAERMRRDAEEAAAKGRESANLAEREAAQAKADEAIVAQKTAKKAESVRITSGGDSGAGRAVGLRSVTDVRITDLKAAVRAYWKTHQPEFEALIMRLATADLRAKKPPVDGIEIIERKAAR